MRPCLRYFSSCGDWSPLLLRLSGWRLSGENTWTDGLSRFITKDDRSGLSCGFSVGVRAWKHLMTLRKKKHETTNGGPHAGSLVLTSPNGIRFGCELQEEVQDQIISPYIMNHCALDVPELRAERAWFEELVRAAAVMARTSAWEPIVGAYLADCHVARLPDFYIAIRERPGTARINHIGWMAQESARVDEAAVIVAELGWPILFGPAQIDGSYLFHFRGPDGGVHDFFWVSEELSQHIR